MKKNQKNLIRILLYLIKNLKEAFLTNKLFLKKISKILRKVKNFNKSMS